MKAVVIHHYDGITQIEEMPRPDPEPDQVVIAVHAASVNPIDWKIRSGNLRMLTGSRFPRILGGECAGVVAATGAAVKGFAIGDPVIALMGIRSMGCFAEYACTRQSSVFPARAVTPEQAACLPIAGLTALQGLRDKGKIKTGQDVLIIGASGGVGHFAVQIALLFGARVTAVCSATNADFVKSLGAETVIDYNVQDFTRGKERYDIIFDAVARNGFLACKRALKPKGIYVRTLPSPALLLNQFLTGFLGGHRARMINVSPRAEDLEWLRSKVQSGAVTVRIQRSFPLEETEAALALSKTGKVQGKLVIRVAP